RRAAQAARLAMVVDFPSPASAEVTATTESGLEARRRSRRWWSRRNCSAAGPIGSRIVTSRESMDGYDNADVEITFAPMSCLSRFQFAHQPPEAHSPLGPALLDRRSSEGTDASTGTP